MLSARILATDNCIPYNEQVIKIYQLKQATKIALAALASEAVVLALHLNNGFLAVITSLVLLSLFQHELIEKGLERLFGPLLAAMIALLAFLSFGHFDIAVYTLVMAVCLYFFAYLYFVGFYRYAMLMGMITAGFILVLAHDSSYLAAVTLATDWISCLAIGLIVSLVVNFLIFPQPFCQQIAPELKKLLHQINLLFTQPPSAHESQLSKVEELLSMLTSYENKLLSLTIANKNLQLMIELLRKIVIIAQSNTLNPSQDILEKLQHCFHHCIDTLNHQPYQSDAFDALFAAISQQRDTLYQERQSGKLSEQALLTNIQRINHYYLLNRAALHLHHCAQLLPQVHASKQITAVKNVWQKIKRTLTENRGDISFNRYALIKAGKMTLAIVAIFLINTYFGWQDFSIQAIITATVLTAQLNLGKATERMYQRLVGIIAGGLVGVGLMYLLQLYPARWLLLSTVFVVYLIGGYFCLRSKKYWYNWLQALIMLPLVLLVTPNAIGTTKIAIERFGGAWEGLIIGLLILYLVKPIYPHKQVLLAMNTGFEQLKVFYQALGQSLLQPHQSQRSISHTIAHARSILLDAQQVRLGDQSRQLHLAALLEAMEGLLVQSELLSANFKHGQKNKLLYLLHEQASPLFVEISHRLEQSAETTLMLAKNKQANTLSASQVKDLEQQLLAIMLKFHQTGTTKLYDLNAISEYCVAIMALRHTLEQLKKILELLATSSQKKQN